MKNVKSKKIIIIVLIILLILGVGLGIAFFVLRKPTEQSTNKLEVIPEVTLEVGTEISSIVPSMFFKNFMGYNEEDFELSFVGDAGTTEIPTVKYYQLDDSQVIVTEDTEIPENAEVKTVITGLDTYTVSIKGMDKTYEMKLTVIDTKAPTLNVKTEEAKVQEDAVKDTKIKDLYYDSCYDNSNEACEEIFLADENGNILEDQSLPKTVGDHDLYLVTKDKTGNISEAIKVKLTIAAKPKDKTSTSTTTTNKTTSSNKTTTNKNTTSNNTTTSSSSKDTTTSTKDTTTNTTDNSGSTANKTEETAACGSQGYVERLSRSPRHGLPVGYVLGPDTAYIWGCDHEPVEAAQHSGDGPLFDMQDKALKECNNAFGDHGCMTWWNCLKIIYVATGKWVGVESYLIIQHSDMDEHNSEIPGTRKDVAAGFMLFNGTIRWIQKDY